MLKEPLSELVHNIKNIRNEIKRKMRMEILRGGTIKLEKSRFIGNIRPYKNTWKVIALCCDYRLTLLWNAPMLRRQLIERLVEIVFIIGMLYRTRKDFMVTIIATKRKKKFPKKGEIIGIENVNSGMTVINSGDITIWRLEEIEKVLIHELIHSCGADRALFNVLDIEACNTFCIKCDENININEVFTDFWAIIMYCIISGRSYKKELDWSWQQMMCVLDHYNFNVVGDIFERELPQNSNVMSYYVLKACVMQNFREMIKFGITFHNDDYCRKTFFDFIVSSCMLWKNEKVKCIKCTGLRMTSE